MYDVHVCDAITWLICGMCFCLAYLSNMIYVMNDSAVCGERSVTCRLRQFYIHVFHMRELRGTAA